MKKSLKKVLSIVLSTSLVLSSIAFTSFNTVTAASAVNVYACEGIQEAAYVEWAAVEGTNHYYVSYSKDGSNYTQIDDELIRQYPDRWRADIVGLAAGDYSVKVEAKDSNNTVIAEKVTPVTVISHDRTGFAFAPSSPFYNLGGVGAYNNDGTLKDGANVIYVTEENFDTVSLSLINKDNKTENAVGVPAICNAMGGAANRGYSNPPLAIRFLGTISDNHAGLDSNSYIELKADKGDKAVNVTFEGIGQDTIFNVIALKMVGAANCEIRNIAFSEYLDDAIGYQGKPNSNSWVHNCDFFYGVKGSGDKEKGDGSVDIKDDSKYMTISNNHFWDCGKLGLCGMKGETGDNFISYHHNWFDHSDSRHPRVRTMSVHVYNNYYIGNSKYGPGASLNSSIFVEGNYFEDIKYPMLQGSMGHDSDGKGGSNTFQDNPGAGKIKAYNNYMTGNYQFTADGKNGVNGTYGGDAYVVETRDEVVPSSYNIAGVTYNNFDTTGEVSVYIQSLASVIETPQAAKDKITKYSGRTGNHFQHIFTAADATDSTRVPELDAKFKAYVADTSDDFISYGGASDGSGPVPTESTTEATTEATTKDTTTEYTTSEPTTMDITPVKLGDAVTNNGNSGISVTYDAATDTWKLADTSDTEAAQLRLPFAAPITSGKVVVSGTAAPTKAAGSWALVKITGSADAATGEYSDVAALVGDGNKNITLRVNGDKTNGITSSKNAMAANKTYNYQFVIDMDAKTATLTIDGTNYVGTMPITATEITGIEAITAVKDTERNLTISTPFVGIVNDNPVPTTDSTTESTTEATTNDSTTESTTEDPNPGPSPAEPVYGDANADTKVDAEDVARVMQYVLNGTPFVNDKKYVDVNEDGKIDSQDAAMILQNALNGDYTLPRKTA